MDSDTAQGRYPGAFCRGLRASEEYCSGYLRAAARMNALNACSLPVARELCQCLPFPATSSPKFITALRQGAARSSCQNARPSSAPSDGTRGPRRACLLRCAWVVRRLIGDHLCFMQLPCSCRLHRVAFQHGTTRPGGGRPISCPPKWEYRDHPTPEAMRRRASI